MDEYFFLQKLINLDKPDLPVYHVKFYDDPTPLAVKAVSFESAGVLGMAYIMHKDGEGWGIEYVESVATGNRVPIDIS